VDEVARHVGGLAGLDVRQLMQKLVEDRAQLGLGDVRAETEMHTAAAKTDMRVRAATQVKTLGMVEYRGVEIAR